MAIMRRGSSLYLKRHVPKRFARVEPRREVWVALHTDSETIAQEKAARVWTEMIEAWEAQLAGDSAAASRRFDAARAAADVRGYRFLSSGDVAKLPIAEFLDRLEQSHDRQGRVVPHLADALIGGVAPPALNVSGALKEYWAIADDRTLGKSEDQVRRWKNPRKKAVKNFIDVVGDVELAKLTPDHMLDFRAWWLERIRAGVTPNSANKDIIHLSDILRTVNRMKRLGLSLPLEGMTFKQGVKNQRKAFSEKWIREQLLRPGAMAGLNTEARCIVLGMVNTGYRPSEGAALLPQHIILDVEYPHIKIEAVGRVLKSQYAERTIPLAGISLEALRECRDGFPRYRDNAGLSDTVNKFLRENKLLESEEHTLYGLRHSFEDRLLDRDTDDRIRRDLMGHALDRQRYGEGASLEKLSGIVQAIAL